MKIAPFALRHTTVSPTPGTPRLFSAGALLMTLCLTACGGGGSSADGGSDSGRDLLANNHQTAQSGNTTNGGAPAQPSAGNNGTNAGSTGQPGDAGTTGTSDQSGKTNNTGNAGNPGNSGSSENPVHDDAGSGERPANSETPSHTNGSGSGTAGSDTNGGATATPGADGSGVTTPARPTPQPTPQPNPSDPASNGSSSSGTGTNAASSSSNDAASTNQQAAGSDTQPTAPVQSVTQAPSPLCAPILTNAQPLTAGTAVGAMPTTPRPATGKATEDPTWHSCVVRLTENAETQPAHPLFTPHSAQQAFSADDSALLLRTDHGEWHLFDPKTGKSIRKLDRISGDAEPQWDPKNPNVLYYLNVDGKDMRIFRLTIDTSPNGTDKAELLADMSKQIHQHWPTATHARTRGGTPSDDDRTWCFMAERNEGSSWNTLGLFSWDMQTGKIIGTQSLPPGSPEYITTSPSGSHCVVQFPYPTGVLAYKRDFSAPYNAEVSGNSLKLLGQGYQKYGDVARNAQGQDMYVGFDVYSNPHHLFMTNLATGEKTTLLTTSFGTSTDTGVQVSGRAIQRPGWVLVSGFGERKQGVNNLKEDDPDRKWFHRKMFAFSLENPPKVLSIANLHHEWDGSKSSTWPRPNGTVNRSFTRMLFNSTWDSMNVRDLDAYLVEIRPDAVPALPENGHKPSNP